jgi:hypothetical protein
MLTFIFALSPFFWGREFHLAGINDWDQNCQLVINNSFVFSLGDGGHPE